MQAEILTGIKASLVELNILGENQKDDPHVEESIQSYAVLLFRVIQDIRKIPTGETYCVVEFGCGTFQNVFFFVNAIAHLYRKKIMYVGIDSDEKVIDRLNQTLPIHFKNSCRYIRADGCDLSWRDQTAIPSKFHTAIFTHPIVEPPDSVEQGIGKDFGHCAARRWLAEIFPKYRETYDQFMAIFHKVLPRCLEPSASLLLQTSYESEYEAILKTLSTVAEDLPKEDQEIPSHRCLAVTFKS